MDRVVRAAVRALGACAAAFLGACNLGNTPCTLNSVSVTPASHTIAVGDTTSLSADVDAPGCLFASPTWASLSPAQATVVGIGSTGLVTAIAAGGPVAIIATVSDRADTALITVNPAAIASISLAIPNASLVETQVAQVAATAKDARGNTLSGRRLTWSSSSVQVSAVDSTGRVLALAPGSTTITARDASNAAVAGTLPLTVVARAPTSIAFVNPASTGPVGVPIALTAQVKDQLGNVMTGRTLTWSVSDAGVATFGPDGSWTRCAVEGGTCAVTGPKLVRYGSDPAFHFRESSTNVACSNGTFGDPLPNMAKACDVANRRTTPGTALLSPLGPGLVIVQAIDASSLAAFDTLTFSAAGRITSWASPPGSLAPIDEGSSRFVPFLPLDSTRNLLRIDVRAVSLNPNNLSVSKVSVTGFTLNALAAGSAPVIRSVNGFTPFDTVFITVNAVASRVGGAPAARASGAAPPVPNGRARALPPRP